MYVVLRCGLKMDIILRTVTEVKLKLFFQNEIITEIIVKPEWKRNCVITTCIVKIN